MASAGRVAGFKTAPGNDGEILQTGVLLQVDAAQKSGVLEGCAGDRADLGNDHADPQSRKRLCDLTGDAAAADISERSDYRGLPAGAMMVR